MNCQSQKTKPEILDFSTRKADYKRILGLKNIRISTQIGGICGGRVDI